MLNSSQKNIKSTNSNHINELEQMMRNQKITDNNLYKFNKIQQLSNQSIDSLPPPPPPPLPQFNQLNNFKLNQSNILQNPINQNVINQSNLLNSSNIQQNIPKFNVPNITKYLNPNYENLNSLSFLNSENSQNNNYQINNNQFNNNQINNNQINNNQIKPVMNQVSNQFLKQLNNQVCNHLNYQINNQLPNQLNNNQFTNLSANKKSNQSVVNQNLISPNITGLPNVSIKRNSPSFNNNIYANSIVSRYCPTTTASTAPNNIKSFYSTSIDQQHNTNENSKYLSNNETGSLYDPVCRTNSQLSFSSLRPESSLSAISNTAANSKSTSGNSGCRQPISALLVENDLDNLTCEKSSIKPPNDMIDHLKKEKEVEYLTDLLVKGLQKNDPNIFGICFKCSKTISDEDGNAVQALGQMYHIYCFNCDVCSKTLKGTTFYSIENKVHCEECYLNTLEKCCICNKVISDRQLKAMGKSYHPACFCCTECNVRLNGKHFTVDYKNNLHCLDCFHEKFAPKCSVCEQPIIPESGQLETVRIVALDRCFHVDCYRCIDCNVLLKSTGDKGCYPLDNHILCKECNNKRFQQYLNSTKN